MNREARVRLAAAGLDERQVAGLGRELGRILDTGDVVLLFGELGAGKTCFARAMARGLGVDEAYAVTSPTFDLWREYPGRIPFHHVDCYRLRGPGDLEAAGIADELGRGGAWAVEWPERLEFLRPPEALEVHLRICPQDPSRRDVLLLAAASWRERLRSLASSTELACAGEDPPHPGRAASGRTNPPGTPRSGV